MMMTLDVGCQQEPKLSTKSAFPEEPESTLVDINNPIIAFSNNNNFSGDKNVDANISCNISNISSSSNNNSNSNSGVSLKSMPRQRLPKSAQNECIGEKASLASDVPKTNRRSHEERFHRNFPDLASCTDDRLIKTYHCALVTDILLQGYLYITSRWFCFYSKLFGKKKLIKIPLSLVLDVSKKKTAKFIPNAVGVTTLNKEYLFGSLLSRDNTYKVMCNAWHAYKSISKKDGSSPESELSETNEELISVDSQITIANQSESTSYEESFSNMDEEDNFEQCDRKVMDEGHQNPAESERCHHHHEAAAAAAKPADKPARKKCKKSPLLELIGYFLNMSSPTKTCVFLIVASILTAMLLVSAFVLSCQLSNLEVLFARIVTKTSLAPPGPGVTGEEADDRGQVLPGLGGGGGGGGDPEEDLISNRAHDDIYADDGSDCQSQKENLFLANLREISTMHHQLLSQINKILTALQRVTFNASSSSSSSPPPSSEQLH